MVGGGDMGGGKGEEGELGDTDGGGKKRRWWRAERRVRIVR